MDKMRMESQDGVARNIDKIAELFPNCITEAIDVRGGYRRSVNFELLKQMLSDEVVDGDEAYEFTWVGKKASIVEANKPIRKTLRPCPEESVNWDTTENLYIEGDNLEVLKLLQESYLGKVKMIYIDPPYNTGHDFVYPDSFIMDNEDYNEGTGYFDDEGNVNFNRENSSAAGKYHSDWCSMIYSRLLLARNLLSSDGVVFVSIDDNEQENLRKIMNEIFGEENFVIQIAWRRTDNQPNIGKVARVKEYIVCYCKNQKNLEFGKLPLTDKAKSEYRYEDEKGLFRRAILLDKTRGRHHYPITTKSGHILNGPWMKTEEEFRQLDSEGAIYWTNGGDEQPYGKIYLSESKGAIPNDFWGIEYGTNQRASLEVEKLFESRDFDFPKPVSLIATLLNLGSDSDSIVMDFFSGSGTTAHAVLQKNVEDGSNRKFIMVQIPEPCVESSRAFLDGYRNICEIGKERIRRAGIKLKSENVGKNTDYGFRVFKIDDSNMNNVYYAAGDYTQEKVNFMESNIKSDRTDLDLLFGCVLDWGLPLSLPYKSEEISGVKVHTYNDGDLIACFDENVPEDVIKEIARRQPLRAVFRDSSFTNSPSKINMEEIFKTMAPDTSVKVL